MTPGGVTPVVHLSQYDEAFQLEFTLYSRSGELDIPSGATAMIEGTKLDGKAYSANATISGNVITVAGDVQISAVAGNNPFQIVLKSGNSTVGSANFTIAVERAAMDYDTVSDSKLAQIQDVTATAAQLTAAAENVTDGVETFEALAESVSDMLADITDDTLSIADKAADAAAVGNALAAEIAPKYSTSSTYAVGDYALYNNALYRCNTAIATAESWTAAHWTAVKIGSELGNLKSDLNITYPDSGDDWSVGLINSTTGVSSTSTKALRTVSRDIASVKALSTQSGYTFLVFGYKVEEGTATFLGWWKNGAFYKGSGATSYYVSSLDFSPLKATEATNYRVCLQRTDATDMEVSESVNLLRTVSVTAENRKRLDGLETSVTAMTPIVQDMETIPDAFKALAQTQENVAYVNGKFINTNVSVGTIVDVENPIVSNTLCYVMCPCKAGDAFTITGDTHGLTNPRAWAFVDTEYKLLSKSSNDVVVENLQLTAESDGYIICNSYSGYAHSLVHHYYYEGVGNAINDLQEQIDNIDASDFNNDASTALFSAQRYISEDWHFAFINVSQGMGLGRNHVIPATKTLWSQSVTADLNQCGIWMSDGVHPFKGDGVTDMYARTIASQLAMVVPSYRDGVGDTTPSVWSGRNILWMGTSIPAGSDPDAGEGTGSTYPALVASLLGATAVNRSKGSSCVRINASTGEYTGMIFNHFARALTRTVAECDAIATDWDSIKGKISGAPSTLSEANVNTMKSHSFENLLLPYLDGTNTMPDLFVIDHGHNDVRPKGIDGKTDLWVTPSVSAIESGILAEDTYMVADNYANLKLALNDDLSGITDLAGFSASLNRNCFKGAVNFLITVILSRNPYARIAIVSDYN